ncbi:MAG: pectinesterase family protein [Pseudomonadota bacterium]
MNTAQLNRDGNGSSNGAAAPARPPGFAFTVPLAFAVAATLACAGARAQDARVVREPTTPPACAVLLATADGAGGDDGARIQAAIDRCPQGQTVRLAPNNEKQGFTAGPLRLAAGVSLLIERGATLYASSNPLLYDRGDGRCGTVDAAGKGCKTFITVDGGQHGGILGEGSIDGQGGRTVDGKSESWWQLARRAQKEDAQQNVPRLIEVNGARDFAMHRVTLRNAANFHVTLNRVDGFTAWGLRIDTPATARNTDGIDPVSSRNITIAHSHIRTGDDGIAIKANQNGVSENISVLHNHFYNGHGMSIGSETNGGVRRVLVDDLSMDGGSSGLRIKSDVSRGGVVEQIRYRNVCLRGVKTPIDIASRYNPRASGTLTPRYRDIAFEQVHSVTPGRVVLQGYDAAHPLQATLRQVVVAGAPRQLVEHAKLDGEPIGAEGGIACADRFAAFPATPPASRRPQLSAEQARGFAYAEVLKHVGPAGAERVDPWDPLRDPLASGAGFSADYTVDPAAKADGARLFNSVQAAVSRAVADSAADPQGGRRRYILVKPGVYRELLYVPAAAAPITLYGEAADAGRTRISATLDAAVSGADYRAAFGAQFAAVDPAVRAMYDAIKDRPTVQTTGSMVVWVRNQGFQARDMTFENAYNKDGGDARAECTPASCGDNGVHAQMNVVHHQAVALQVDGADKAQFENLRLIGFQDTLFLKAPQPRGGSRSFFNRSYIEGDVDFIFGDSTAYFHRSEIKSLGDRSTSYVAAPDTNLRSRYGFVFEQCDFSHDGSANALRGRFYLARQWFHNQKCTPYGSVALPGYSCAVGEADGYQSPRGSISPGVLETVGKVVILNSRIGAHIQRGHPWADWNKNGTLPYRPAQFDADDFRANLRAAGIDPARQLGHAAAPDANAPPSPADIFLGEFNNTNY